jgi:putative transposase
MNSRFISDIRKIVVNNTSELVKNNKWLLDAKIAFTTNIKKSKKTKRFKLQFKKLKQNQILKINHKYYKNSKCYPRFWKCEKLKLFNGGKLPKKVKHQLILKKERKNDYYVIIPVNNDNQVINRNNDNDNNEIIACDPGCRTFITAYDTNENVLEIGKNDINKIYRLCKNVDNYISIINSNKISKRERYLIKTRKLPNLRNKIKNYKKDFHHKVSKYLCLTYKMIMIPQFDVHNMIKKRNRNINSKIARNLLNWGHGQFLSILKEKAKKYNTIINICDESYTTKTCNNCGNLNDIKEKKIFTCEKCNIEFDRDWNASKNILIKRCDEILKEIF